MRVLPPKIAAVVATPDASPVWFLEVGFDPVLRLCSRFETVVDGDAYTLTAMRVSENGVRIFNEEFQRTEFYHIPAGTAYTLHRSEGRPPFRYVDTIEWQSGELAGVQYGVWIDVQFASGEPLQTPRQYPAAPVFNHLVPEGTVVKTRTGQEFIARRRR